VSQILTDQIIREYEALVEPFQARGEKSAANDGLAHLIATYGPQNVRTALAGLVAGYEARGH
jgi:hypothetical protein